MVKFPVSLIGLVAGNIMEIKPIFSNKDTFVVMNSLYVFMFQV